LRLLGQVNDDDVKRRNTFFPFAPPPCSSKRRDCSTFAGMDPPICLLTPRIAFLFRPVLVHLMALCKIITRHFTKERARSKFFSRKRITLLDWTDRTLLRNHLYAKFGFLNRIDFPCSPICIFPTSLPRSQSRISPQKKKSPSVFFRSPTPP